MNKIGEILRTTREKRNLTLSQAAQKIKVREEYLEKIENDAVLSKDVFTIGYIRLYSKYLRVNVDNLINELKDGISEAVEDSIESITDELVEKKPAKHNKKKLFVVAAITAVSIVALLSFLSQKEVAQEKQIDKVQKEAAKEMAKPQAEEIQNVQQKEEEKYSIDKIDDGHFDVKNIGNDSRPHILALDSTMVTFLSEAGEVIEEIFVKLGDKKDIPKGHKNISIKTRIPSSIKVQ